MKNKVIRFVALFAMIVLASCQKQEEKINLYGVQDNAISRTSPQAILAFLLFTTVIVILVVWFYKKITKKP